MCRFVIILGMLSLQARGMKIELNYDYDTHGFFERPGAREAMRAVADFFESIIDDRLLEIDPAQHGGSWTALIFNPAAPFGNHATLQIPNLVVPADTIVIFAAGADISPAGVGGSGGSSNIRGTQEWIDRVKFRGKAGAAASPPNEFGPWGGMISFSLNADWNFSLERNELGKMSFVAVAVHEIAHVLGVGTAPSWSALRQNGYFTGPNATSSFGGPVPLNSDGAHWRDDRTCVFSGSHDPLNPLNVLSKTYGSFGTPHGNDQIALMDPSACLAGDEIKVFTDLDIGALVDIGWKVRSDPKLVFAAPQAGAEEVRLRWVTSSFHDYRVERSGTAGSWTTVVEISGDGTERDLAIPTEGAPSGFFRIGVTRKPAAPSMALASGDPLANEEENGTRSGESSTDGLPRMVTGCFCHPEDVE